MNPNMLAALRLNLLDHEGIVLKVYDDDNSKPIIKGSLVMGNPTIGIGRNLAGVGISAGEADELCAHDIDRVVLDLDQWAPWWQALNDARQVAMLELGFNLGVQHMLQAWPNTMRAMQQGRYSDAACNILTNSVWIGQVGTARATAIAGLVSSGVLI